MPSDPATLDQLRVLVAIAETGSFSAAGRRLHRVQSAVSHAVAAMEAQIGAALFERTARRPTLTPTGEAVLTHARAVCARADALRDLVETLQRGEEPVIGVAVDMLYPCRALTEACRDFAAAWPGVQLRLHTDTMGAVAALVREGQCDLGVVGEAGDERGLRTRHLGVVRMVPVVAPHHALARERGPLAAERLAEEVQIVLSERGSRGGDGPDAEPARDHAVLSPRTWRVHDLQTKRMLLAEGLGWGNLPAFLADEDLAAGRLVRLLPAAWPPDGVPVSLASITRPERTLGPAGRWLLDRLAAGCTTEASTS